MKNMRFFPVIALLLLGLIAYALYKTSNFVNKNVNARTLLTQDSLVKSSNLNNALTNGSTMLDTFPLSSTPPSNTSLHSTPTHKPTSDKANAALTATSPVSTSLATATPKSDKTKSNKEIKLDANNNAQTPKPYAIVTTKGVTALDSSAQSKKETTKTTFEKRFHVVIGSYKNEANAKAKALDFEEKNNKKATVVNQGGYFRVSADDFEFATSAAQYAQKLKEAGNDFIILKF